MSRDNLPHPLTSFVGRKREIRRVRSLVTGVRLLTLIGPGGSGKSRLALAVASGSIPRFDDGVFLVELAPLVESRLVLRALAEEFDLPDRLGRPLSLHETQGDSVLITPRLTLGHCDLGALVCTVLMPF